MNIKEMWLRSNELRREAEAKEPLKLVYSVHCYVGSIEWLEDAEGVFWVDLDGEFMKVENESPDMIEHMRSKNVPEETIRRIVKQCQEAKERKGS